MADEPHIPRSAIFILTQPSTFKGFFMREQFINSRCVSGLHERTQFGPCRQCQALRRSIWNSDNPRAAQQEHFTKDAAELEAARIFCLERARSEQAELEAQARQYWDEAAHKVVAYRQNNASKIRAKSNNDRARRINAPGNLTNGLLDRLYKLQKGKCPCCRRALGKDFHMDHIKPLSKGGANVDSNIQLLRSRCNLVKSAMDPVLFMQLNGFLL